jgi:hypothetical protein
VHLRERARSSTERYWSAQKRELAREQSLESEELQLSGVLRSSASTPARWWCTASSALLQDAFDELGEREKQLSRCTSSSDCSPRASATSFGTPESSVRRELARLQASLASFARAGALRCANQGVAARARSR